MSLKLKVYNNKFIVKLLLETSIVIKNMTK